MIPIIRMAAHPESPEPRCAPDRQALPPDERGRLDPESVETLVSGLRIIALRSLSDADAAEEAVQETLARGLAALEEARLQSPEKIGAYFRGIARHVIADMLRERSRTEGLGIAAEAGPASPHPDALAALISREDQVCVRQALDALTVTSRECLRLSFYEGLTPAEIATRLGEPPPRVRKRLSRALQHLRDAFFAQARSTPPKGTVSPHGHEREPPPTVTRGARSPEVRRGIPSDASDAGDVNE